VEFLGLPPTHAETVLHRGLLDKLKDFLIELGFDFCFVDWSSCKSVAEILRWTCSSSIVASTAS
jgi:predicted nuclease of restriction endonuclease-like (RecB) superfamily